MIEAGFGANRSKAPRVDFARVAKILDHGFKVSALATAAAFFVVGALRGWILRRSIVAAGLETLLIGGVAAALAYAAGYLTRQLYLG
ncbi:MAG: hypothetical protein HC855_10105 [Rhizobiales bacterium]|nr:hypothetical protein [Hyphomicrobiales bacterium]